jgi:hypothetical protein
MSSTQHYQEPNYFYEDDYCDAIEVGEYIVLTTYQYGYTYVLEYSRAYRTFNIISTDNPGIFPKQ